MYLKGQLVITQQTFPEHLLPFRFSTNLDPRAGDVWVTAVNLRLTLLCRKWRSWSRRWACALRSPCWRWGTASPAPVTARTASTTFCGARPAPLLSVSPLHTDRCHQNTVIRFVTLQVTAWWPRGVTALCLMLSKVQPQHPCFCFRNCSLTSWPTGMVCKGPWAWVAAWHCASHGLGSGERQMWQCGSLWAASCRLLIPVCTWDLKGEQASGCSWRWPLSTRGSYVHTPLTSKFSGFSCVVYTIINDISHTGVQSY